MVTGDRLLAQDGTEAGPAQGNAENWRGNSSYKAALTITNPTPGPSVLSHEGDPPYCSQDTKDKCGTLVHMWDVPAAQLYGICWVRGAQQQCG